MIRTLKRFVMWKYIETKHANNHNGEWTKIGTFTVHNREDYLALIKKMINHTQATGYSYKLNNLNSLQMVRTVRNDNKKVVVILDGDRFAALIEALISDN